MKRPFSICVCFASCLAGAVFAIFAATQLPYGITQESEGWTSMFFRVAVAPILGVCALVLGVIPSAVLYARGRRRLDLISLCVSGTTLGLVVVTWLVIEPLRQSIIFGQ